MVDLDAPAQTLAEGLGAERHSHELLNVDAGVCVRTAVDDVHHRHGQRARGRAAEVAVERQARACRGSVGNSEAHAEDRIRADARLVVGTVGRDERGVDEALIVSRDVVDCGAELVEHCVDRLQHTLTEVAILAITKLVRLERAGRCTRRNRGAAHRTVGQPDLDLDRGVASRVENLACDHCVYKCQRALLGFREWEQEQFSRARHPKIGADAENRPNLWMIRPVRAG